MTNQNDLNPADFSQSDEFAARYEEEVKIWRQMAKSCIITKPVSQAKLAGEGQVSE